MSRLFFDYFELNKNLLSNDLSVKVKRYLKETNYISLNDIDFRKKKKLFIINRLIRVKVIETKSILKVSVHNDFLVLIYFLLFMNLINETLMKSGATNWHFLVTVTLINVFVFRFLLGYLVFILTKKKIMKYVTLDDSPVSPSTQK